VIDAWKPQLGKIGIAAVMQQLDPCFVAFREACEELQTRFPSGRLEWLPFGVDTDVYMPTPWSRDVFVYWMGRRPQPCTDTPAGVSFQTRGISAASSGGADISS
jgi:hypothetical protein